MLVLALDTTTRQGSIALARGRDVLNVYAGDATITHGERLPGDLMRVLVHAVGMRDIDLFAVAAGPGSFTGLRIGIATMQGLAMANGRSLVGVSALDSINEAVRSPDVWPSPLNPASEVVVWMDAQRGEVFSAVYDGDRIVDAPIVDTPAAILARVRSESRSRERPRVFAGDGARAYHEMIRREVPEALVVSDVPVLAPSIARLAVAHERRFGPSPPDAIRPIYIRRSDAELARDRRQADFRSAAP
jgi:tRNA threonylcarbamoyladenosine biosynthesis protein TsaB